jgi:hypothetical protein
VEGRKANVNPGNETVKAELPSDVEGFPIRGKRVGGKIRENKAKS